MRKRVGATSTQCRSLATRAHLVVLRIFQCRTTSAAQHQSATVEAAPQADIEGDVMLIGVQSDPWIPRPACTKGTAFDERPGVRTCRSTQTPPRRSAAAVRCEICAPATVDLPG